MTDFSLDLKKIADLSLQEMRNPELSLRIRKAFNDLYSAAVQADMVVQMESLLHDVRNKPINELVPNV